LEAPDTSATLRVLALAGSTVYWTQAGKPGRSAAEVAGSHCPPGQLFEPALSRFRPS